MERLGLNLGGPFQEVGVVDVLKGAKIPFLFLVDSEGTIMLLSGQTICVLAKYIELNSPLKANASINGYTRDKCFWFYYVVVL